MKFNEFGEKKPIKEIDGCWVWTGPKGSRGYGIVCIDGQKILAHRFSYRFYIGPIPNGMCICHKCDNPPCINPNHLFLGTMADNMRDRKEKGRCSGEWNGRAKLSESQVLEIRKMAGKIKQIQLSRMFGVSKVCICDILRRDTWIHL